jgi:hypothetical protein
MPARLRASPVVGSVHLAATEPPSETQETAEGVFRFGNTDTNMRAQKLWRIEQLSWNPPTFEFSIERHGQTVNGSSRATVYRWSVDLEKGTAHVIDEKRRQLYQMDKRLAVKPIAESLADAIIGGKEDGRIVVNKDGSVRLKIGEIIPRPSMPTSTRSRPPYACSPRSTPSAPPPRPAANSVGCRGPSSSPESGTISPRRCGL